MAKRIKEQFWTRELIQEAAVMSFKKLSPKVMSRNPVILVTALAALMSSIAFMSEMNAFSLQISAWLWFTVLFANFSEGLAEGKGKAQAGFLNESKRKLKARLYNRETQKEEEIDANDLRRGDIFICRAGDVIPVDGEVIEGVASVDESAITGESAPVIRESGGDRSAVTGGTSVKSDWIVVKMSVEIGENLIDKMIDLIEGASRQKTPNEIALTLVLAGLSIVLLSVVVSLKYYGNYSLSESIAQSKANHLSSVGLEQLSFALSIPTLAALFVCLIPTTIGGLLSAIGISGMNRLIASNVIAKSGRAVEAAGDISVLLLDKTGTITFGNRRAHEMIPDDGINENTLALSALFSSLSDETPEGRSIVDLAKKLLGNHVAMPQGQHLELIPFSAETRMSGVNMTEALNITEQGKDHSSELQVRRIRKGSVDAIIQYAISQQQKISETMKRHVHRISKEGGTPLLVFDHQRIVGVIFLKDIVKPGMREKFLELRKIGIKTIMITGDNPLTAASIAAEAGVDDFMAEATPEAKLLKIRQEQALGNLVAMTGDGTNDAPALAQADVGVTMNTGTQAAREAGNMVDLDSDPTKLISIVQVGKQLLITRGALTTFSFANDIAKYFVILPAMFAGLYATGGQNFLGAFNIMDLGSPQSAILSAVIFNALIIVLLTPLALRGVKYSTLSTEQLLLKNIFVYGLGGMVVPFVAIKIIDVVVNFLGLV